MNKAGIGFKEAIEKAWERGNRYVILNSDLEPLTTQDSEMYMLDEYFVYDIYTKAIEHKMLMELPFS